MTEVKVRGRSCDGAPVVSTVTSAMCTCVCASWGSSDSSASAVDRVVTLLVSSGILQNRCVLLNYLRQLITVLHGK